MQDREGDEYWSSGELESVRSCPACSESSSDLLYEGLYDYLEGVPGQWGFRICSGCESLFLDPRPAPSAIGKAYSTASYFTHQSGSALHALDNGSSLAWRLANGYLNFRFGCKRTPASAVGEWLIPLLVPIRQQFDYFYRHLPLREGRLLDVGCGNGAFLLRAVEAGWNVEGIEPDPAAAEQAGVAGFLVHNGDIHSYDARDKFDIVTLSHVFEHLHDPSAVLVRCFELLSPGGTLWMAMPNAQGLGHKVYRRSWFALDPPRHLLLPRPSELKRLCFHAGFSEVHLLKRGISGSSGIRLSAIRATQLGRPSKMSWFWYVVVNAISVFSTRWSDEIVITAKKPK